MTSIVLGLIVIMSAISLEEIEPNQFMGEYRIAAKELSVKYGTSKGSGRIVIPHLKGAMTIKYFSDHGFTKYEVANQSKLDERTIQLVECVGESTGFSLGLRGLSKEYQVTSLGLDESSRLRFNRKYGKFGKAPFEISGTPLIEFLDHKSVKNMKVMKIRESNRDLIKLTFENGPDDKPNRLTILLLPNSLAITYFETIPGFVTGKANPIKYEVEYLNDHEKYPIPKRVKFTDPNLKVDILEWETFSFEGTPEKEFKMEFYNLPDVASGGKSSSISIMSKGLILSLTIGLIGLGLKQALKKRANPLSV